MALLLHSPSFTSIHMHTACSIKCRPSFSVQFSFTPLHTKKPSSILHNSGKFSTRAFDTESSEKLSDEYKEISGKVELADDNGSCTSAGGEDDKYPSGEFVYKELDPWASFTVKLKMLFALPWERVKKGSVLTMKIRGEISDQLKGRFSSGLSLPQICENFIKAAYDPRISGIYLHIEPLNCGWGKVEEIRRHILDFKKSGAAEILSRHVLNFYMHLILELCI